MGQRRSRRSHRNWSSKENGRRDFSMQSIRHLEVQNEQEVYLAVVSLRNGIGTFEDALIGSLGTWRSCSATLTFDEDAAKRLPGFQLI